MMTACNQLCEIVKFYTLIDASNKISFSCAFLDIRGILPITRYVTMHV